MGLAGAFWEYVMSPSMVKFLSENPECTIDTKGVVHGPDGWPIRAGGLVHRVPYDAHGAKLAEKASKKKWASLFALPMTGSENEFCRAAKAAGF